MKNEKQHNFEFNSISQRFVCIKKNNNIKLERILNTLKSQRFHSLCL